jgi:hypothetical protein
MPHRQRASCSSGCRASRSLRHASVPDSRPHRVVVRAGGSLATTTLPWSTFCSPPSAPHACETPVWMIAARSHAPPHAGRQSPPHARVRKGCRSSGVSAGVAARWLCVPRTYGVAESPGEPFRADGFRTLDPSGWPGFGGRGKSAVRRGGGGEEARSRARAPPSSRTGARARSARARLSRATARVAVRGAQACWSASASRWGTCSAP